MRTFEPLIFGSIVRYGRNKGFWRVVIVLKIESVPMATRRAVCSVPLRQPEQGIYACKC